ncbi:hypothetical protein PABG_01807 [Paracoccidioides brasiliensis Pb03]|nr:hypothetical protein PABG_01807 [Paracoccidioides brasiliensis Pb03]
MASKCPEYAATEQRRTFIFIVIITQIADHQRLSQLTEVMSLGSLQSAFIERKLSSSSSTVLSLPILEQAFLGTKHISASTKTDNNSHNNRDTSNGQRLNVLWRAQFACFKQLGSLNLIIGIDITKDAFWYPSL